MLSKANQSVTFSCEGAQIDRDLFSRLAYGHGYKITKYFLRCWFGIAFLTRMTDQELLFLMPNNAKKRLGFPLTRVAKMGRKKREYVNACRNAIIKNRMEIRTENTAE